MQLISKANLTLALCILATQGAHAAPTVYVDDSNGQLATLNVGTGQSTVIGSLPDVFTDIGFSPTGQLYGIDFSSLYRVDPMTAEGTLVGSTGVSAVNALVFSSSGTLYAAGGDTLYTLNTATGAGTAVGTFGNYSSEGDLAFDQSGDLLLTAAPNAGGSDVLLKLNTATGAGTPVGPIGFSTVYGLALGPDNVLYGETSGTEQVISINPTTGAGTLLASYAGGAISSVNGSAFFGEASRQPPAVPESSSFALLVLGLLPVGLLVRKRRV